MNISKTHPICVRIVKTRAIIYIKSLNRTLSLFIHTHSNCLSSSSSKQISLWLQCALFVHSEPLFKTTLEICALVNSHWIKKCRKMNKINVKKQSKVRVLTHFFVDSNWLAYVMLIVPHHFAAFHRPHCHWWQFAPAFVSSTCWWRSVFSLPSSSSSSSLNSLVARAVFFRSLCCWFLCICLINAIQ